MRPKVAAIRDERGVAVMIVTLVSILLVLLGLSITFSSMTDFSISNDLQSKKMALVTASAGFNAEKGSLEGTSLNTVLAATTVVPKYINYSEPSPGTDAYTYFTRNPIAPMEAMNVDFDNPPAQIGTRTVTGLLTPASGDTLASGGRYWAKITDNDDGDSDLTTDQDGRVYLRVVGIQRNAPGQVSIYGGTVKNSVSIIEATLKRDMTMDQSSPFTIYGSNVTPIGSKLFNVVNFSIDGYNHAGMTLADLIAGNNVHTTGGDMAAIDVLNDDPGASDATAIRDTIYNALLGPPDKRGKVIGDKSDYPLGVGDGIPSLRDATNIVRNSSNEDATNIFDANYIMNFIQKVESFADVTFPDGTNFNGNLGDDGSVAGGSTQITYCEGDCTFGGTGYGAGLLIVRGRLTFNGNRAQRGLILVIGDGELVTGGSSTGILGGLYVAKIDGPDGNGDYSYGDPQYSLNGRTEAYYQEDGIQLGYSLLPMKTNAWREITPGIEPSF